MLDRVLQRELPVEPQYFVGGPELRQELSKADQQLAEVCYVLLLVFPRGFPGLGGYFGGLMIGRALGVWRG
eukprot:8998346-Lingulodinium_polyedra.AAC.1